MDNIEEIVKSVIGKISQRQPDAQFELEKIFYQFIGEKNKEFTRFTGCKNNIVFIMVDSPIRLHQLKSKKIKLLRGFKKVSPEIKDIIYKVGQI